jgi:hypothetical protein
MSSEKLGIIDLAEELQELEELLKEKLSEENHSWNARLNELIFFMERFIECDKRYKEIEVKVHNLKNKLRTMAEVEDENC